MYHPTQFPYEMDRELYSDALGLAILQEGNRRLVYWTPETARWVLLGARAGGGAAARRASSAGAAGRDSPAALTAVLAVGIVGWTLTGRALRGRRQQPGGEAGGRRRCMHPFSWVDDATRRTPTLYMGAGEADPTPENLIEFWNRSIARVSSLDGTVRGPGPSGGPNVTANGTLYWTRRPGRRTISPTYAVEDYPCVDFAGRLAATHPYRAGGKIKSGD